MDLSPDLVDDLRKRLHRVVGQVQGIDRMLVDGRECRDVVIQLAAASKALERAGVKLVTAEMSFCLEHPDEAAAEGLRLADIERMFVELS